MKNKEQIKSKNKELQLPDEMLLSSSQLKEIKIKKCAENKRASQSHSFIVPIHNKKATEVKSENEKSERGRGAEEGGHMSACDHAAACHVRESKSLMQGDRAYYVNNHKACDDVVARIAVMAQRTKERAFSSHADRHDLLVQ